MKINEKFYMRTWALSLTTFGLGVLVANVYAEFTGNTFDNSTQNAYVENSIRDQSTSNTPMPLISEQPPSALSNRAENLANMESIETNNVITANSLPEDLSNINQGEAPTAHQLDAQHTLEQVVDGEIMFATEEALIPTVVKSKEFTLLTESQRNLVLHRIMSRLNNGEIRPEDAYPGRT